MRVGREGEEEQRGKGREKTTQHQSPRVLFIEKEVNMYLITHFDLTGKKWGGKWLIWLAYSCLSLETFPLEKSACIKCLIYLVTTFYSNSITYSPLSWHGWKDFFVPGEVVTHSFAVLFINSFLQKHFLSCWEGRRV